MLQNITAKPRALAASSTPRAIVVKNGLEMSDRTRASIFVRFERSWRARAFGTYPSSAIASSTRCRVAALTYPELFRTRETVMAETPARSATSLIRLIFGVTRFASVPRAVTGGCPRRGQPPEYERLERSSSYL